MSTLVFLALLAVGVLGSAERLVAAARARVLTRQARERLDSTDPGRPQRPAPGSGFRADWGPDGLTVSGCRLRAAPAGRARQIDFTVALGETLFVTGASGTGKTTLLDAITTALQLQPAAGVVTAVLADDYLFTGTIASNIRLADPAASDADIQELLAALLLDRSGLDPGTGTGIGGRNLSGGEQRRLHIARALATRPDVLLIDEPATGLDTGTATTVLAAIRRRLPCAVLILATHELPARPDLAGPAWTTLSLA